MTHNIEYSYEHAPTIREFSRSNAFVRGLMGPFGSGKSSGCVIEIMRRAAAQQPGPDGIRRSRWAVIRNTYGQLSDTTIKTFMEWMPPDSCGHYVQSEHNYTIDKMEGVVCEIMFRALDRPDHIRNLLSLELTGAWVNEAREIPWSIIDALQGRVGRFPKKVDGGPTWYGIIMDTNPPDDMSGWYHYFEDMRPSNAAVFKQPSGQSDAAENIGNLPNGYYQNLALGKSDEFVKVYIDGQYGFVLEGKPVYPEYNDTIHCRECSPVSGKPIRRGWDFGLTPACTFSQLLPSGQWIVFDEMVATSMGIDRFSDDVLLHIEHEHAGYQFEDYADPAGVQRAQTDEKSCYEIMLSKGIRVIAGEVAPSLRIEAVKKPLNTMIAGSPAFLLHPRCKVLRRGFMGGYQYRRMQTSIEKYADKPEKNDYSHPHDALQYDASKLFGGMLRGRDQSRKWAPLKYDNRGII